jgi:hypothetical protein
LSGRTCTHVSGQVGGMRWQVCTQTAQACARQDDNAHVVLVVVGTETLPRELSKVRLHPDRNKKLVVFWDVVLVKVRQALSENVGVRGKRVVGFHSARRRVVPAHAYACVICSAMMSYDSDNRIRLPLCCVLHTHTQNCNCATNRRVAKKQKVPTGQAMV